jgi:putative hydrolase of the HAD superfamily
MKILLLDCDQTLYQNAGLMSAIRERMVLYMVKVLGKPVEEMAELRKKYLKAYGTTLAGLMRHQQIDPYQYMKFVHHIDISDYLKTDPRLRKTLTTLGIPINILSNAPRDHIGNVLSKLGIGDVPEKIYSIEDFNFEGKPNFCCFQKVCNDFRVEAAECLLVDDDPQNLEGARDFGMHTCLVDEKPDGKFDLSIPDIYELSNHKELFGE